MKVEIWSDVVCPWCYIGKRRFEAALARFAHRDEVEVVWRSFELDASAPPSEAAAGAYAERLAVKYRCSVAEAQAMIDSMTSRRRRGGRWTSASTCPARQHVRRPPAAAPRRGAACRTPSRSAWTAPPSPRARRSRTWRARARWPWRSGCDADEVDGVLASQRYAEAVRADEAPGQAYGISGVPFFVVDGRYGISGAQPADVVLAGAGAGLGRARPADPGRGRRRRRAGLRGRLLRGLRTRVPGGA